MKLDKFRLLFFGSDAFSVRVLRHLVEERICSIQVITGKHSELDQFAARTKLRSHRWPIPSDLSQQFSDQFNIGLVASFGHLIDINTIKIFRFGLFNVHPSLLPQYRGSTPIQSAILDGQQETGCTIMQIPPVAKFDIGDIILQERLKIKHREYAIDLRDRLADLGAVMTTKFLENYEQCLESSRTQNEAVKSYARKLKPRDGELEFRSKDTASLDRKFRAYYGFTDLYVICLDGLKVSLSGLLDPNEVVNLKLDDLIRKFRPKDQLPMKAIEPGTIYFHKLKHLLCIKCSDDRWMAFKFATPEFKAKMTALEFYNGYLSRLKTNLTRSRL